MRYRQEMLITDIKCPPFMNQIYIYPCASVVTIEMILAFTPALVPYAFNPDIMKQECDNLIYAIKRLLNLFLSRTTHNRKYNKFIHPFS